jgi:hypothetical protein
MVSRRNEYNTNMESSSPFQSSLTYSGAQYGSLSMPIDSNSIREPPDDDDEKETLLFTSSVSEESPAAVAAAAAAAAVAMDRSTTTTTTHRAFLRKLSRHIFPARWDIVDEPPAGTSEDTMDMNMDSYNEQQHRNRMSHRSKAKTVHRSMTRRLHLLLTEPDRYVPPESLVTVFFFIS